jgi:hypothetical protein
MTATSAVRPEISAAKIMTGKGELIYPRYPPDQQLQQQS